MKMRFGLAALADLELTKPMSKGFIRRLLRVLLLAVLPIVSFRASAQEIWMFAGPHVNHPAPGWEGVRRDMGDMWKTDAPWKAVSHAVNVIQFPPTSVGRASDDDLRLAVSDI